MGSSRPGRVLLWTGGAVLALSGILVLLIPVGGYAVVAMLGRPGWVYTAAGQARPNDGLRNEIPEQHGVRLLVHAWTCAGGVCTELDITNGTGAPLLINTTEFRLVDANGIPTHPIEPPESAPAPHRPWGVIRLADGETRRVAHFYDARTAVRGLLFLERNPGLRKVTVEFDVNRSDGLSSPMRVPLEWRD